MTTCHVEKPVLMVGKWYEHAANSLLSAELAKNRMPYKQEVRGSSPRPPTISFKGLQAQWSEYFAAVHTDVHAREFAIIAPCSLARPASASPVSAIA